MSQSQIDEDDVYTPYLREFDIEYSTESLLIKANHHQLTKTDLAGEYTVNIVQLEACYGLIEHVEKIESLNQLFVQVATWPKQLTLEDFSERLSVCMESWLEASQQNVALKTIFDILNCVSLSSHTKNASQQWPFYLYDLLSESIFTYQNHQIRYLLEHDPITNLPNTNVLLRQINTKTSVATATEFCLISVRFIIERGSLALSPILPTTLSIKVVELLEDCLPEPFTTYQSGNLLFTCIIDKQLSETQFNLLAVKIQHRFEQIINIDHQAFLVTPIIGAVLALDKSNAFAYNQARAALSHAFNTKQDYVIYSPEISEAVERQKQLDLDVTAAFNNEDLELYLQPILNLPEGRCVGAEVLLRWPNAKTKGIYPNVVVEIINKVGLGKMFTRWLIHSVCRLSSELIKKHQLPIYLTLNLRAEDLYDIELPHLILQSALFWKISPDDIVLEITENGILEENETTTSTIKQITDNGFKLALDDFGTGYSSMARLRTMPISLIKIDQTFVKNIENSNDDYEMVKSMAFLANSLGKEVLVEGVESASAVELINQIGIKKAQGFFFSKPMPFDDFVKWAKNKIAN